MDHVTDHHGRLTAFWHAIGAAFVVLARTSGASLHHHPLPEVREAARDWRGK